MTLVAKLRSAVRAARRRVGHSPEAERMQGHALTVADVDLKEERASAGLRGVFFRHTGRTVHKWVHYLDIYERHFASYRGSDVRLLEIGVFKGGSLEMWRSYFGPGATIFGIDLNPECAHYVAAPNQVRIGSQDDPAFLRSVIAEMGAPDIVLDDGSHVGRHQRTSFETLFPLLKVGGLYVIEDLHTSYWPGIHEGGYRRASSGIEQVKQMIDDLHAWYHHKPTSGPAQMEIGAIHVYDSIVVIEKVSKPKPGHIRVGLGDDRQEMAL